MRKVTVIFCVTKTYLDYFCNFQPTMVMVLVILLIVCLYVSLIFYDYMHKCIKLGFFVHLLPQMALLFIRRGLDPSMERETSPWKRGVGLSFCRCQLPAVAELVYIARWVVLTQLHKLAVWQECENIVTDTVTVSCN